MDIFDVPLYFPQQRPVSGTFDAWASETTGEITRDVIDAGLRALGADEEERIPAEFAGAHPAIWESLVAERGRRDESAEILLVGSVVAGLEERRRQLDPAALEWLEADEHARNDRVESLAVGLAPDDLWNPIEVVVASELFACGRRITQIVDRLWSDWHEQRMCTLVRRLRERLPATDFPAASSALDAACRAFERNRRIRARVPEVLLLGALPSVAEALRRVA